MSVNSSLLDDINTFLSQVSMGRTYFGKRAAGNSNVVAQLERGGTIEIKTANRLIQFMTEYRLNDGSAVIGLKNDKEILVGADTRSRSHSRRTSGEGKKLFSNRVQEPISFERSPNIKLVASTRAGNTGSSPECSEPEEIDNAARHCIEGSMGLDCGYA